MQEYCAAVGGGATAPCCAHRALWCESTPPGLYFRRVTAHVGRQLRRLPCCMTLTRILGTSSEKTHIEDYREV